MKTILFNTLTNKVTHHKPTGYYMVDGQRPALPAHIAELEFLQATPPPHNPETEKLTGGKWQPNLSVGTYSQAWQIVPLTAKEIALRAWKHEAYPQRLNVHSSVLFTPMGTAYRNYLQDRGYPVELTEDGNYQVWIDVILPAHQPYIDSLVQQGLCSIHQRPV